MSSSRRELDAGVPDNILAELALWKHFTDMHPDQTQNPPNDTGNPPCPPPPQVPPETYNYLIHALLSLQASAQNGPSTYPYPVPLAPLPNYNHPLPIPAGPIAGPSSFYSTDPLIPHLPQTAGPSRLVSSPAASSTTVSAAHGPEGAEDAMSTTEDKRRRNTAASARFRVKKKLKTLNLARTVTDLTGRTEELEREATDLRRENAWLKEIVLLKGRNLATLNTTSAPGIQRDQDQDNDRTHVESESEPTVSRAEKGKEKEC